jgi:hypothetical protein
MVGRDIQLTRVRILREAMVTKALRLQLQDTEVGLLADRPPGQKYAE